MDTKPMLPNLWSGPVLGIFANRIAQELERHEAEQALRQAEQDYRGIFENVSEGIYRSLPDGAQLRANPALVKLNGYDNEAEVLAAVKDIAKEWYVEPKRRAEFKRLMSRYGRVENFVSEIYRHKTRERIWVSENARAVYDDGGNLRYYEGTVLDITARKHAEDALRASESRFRAFIENAQDIIILLDVNGIILYLSPAVAEVLDYDPKSLLGQNALDLVHPYDLDKVTQAFHAIREDSNRSQRMEFRYRHADDSWRVLEAVASNCIADPALAGIVINARDVTERYEAEQHIKYLASHDSLTGLPNRNLFKERCDDAIVRAQRYDHRFGLLFIDLDRFKAINDSLGHAVGDQMLQTIGRRLAQLVRQSDTVARLGGDEFAVLVDAIKDPQGAGFIAQKLIDGLVEPVKVAGQQLYISASIGIGCYPEDGENAATLLKNADIAMYHAKHEGRNTYRFFSAEMNAKALENLLLANELRRALEQDEFVLHYQPRIDLRSGEIVGVEALIRWQHRKRGLLAPLAFIQLAEETGLIEAIGEWVLRTACKQAAAWRASGLSPLVMAVNLSPRQLNRPEFPQRVAAILAETGLPSQRVELEITESTMMLNPDRTKQILQDFEVMNVSVAIDDFGTAYSSLSYIKRFHIDCLKIDASFISGIPNDADDVAITTAIIAMARSLKIRLIAEGVQTESQRRFLMDLGCHEAQGFLFSKPLPAVDIVEMLSHRYVSAD